MAVITNRVFHDGLSGSSNPTLSKKRKAQTSLSTFYIKKGNCISSQKQMTISNRNKNISCNYFKKFKLFVYSIHLKFLSTLSSSVFCVYCNPPTLLLLCFVFDSIHSSLSLSKRRKIGKDLEMQKLEANISSRNQCQIPTHKQIQHFKPLSSIQPR